MKVRTVRPSSRILVMEYEGYCNCSCWVGEPTHRGEAWVEAESLNYAAELPHAWKLAFNADFSPMEICYEGIEENYDEESDERYQTRYSFSCSLRYLWRSLRCRSVLYWDIASGDYLPARETLRPALRRFFNERTTDSGLALSELLVRILQDLGWGYDDARPEDWDGTLEYEPWCAPWCEKGATLNVA